MIVVAGLTWACRHKRDFEAVITIEDPTPRSPHASLRFHRHPHPDHLVLQFFDLDYPLPDPFHQPWMRMAEPADVERAITFAKRYDDLLIHCHAGVSRAPAIALAILTEQLGDPLRALKTVLQLRPIAVPNRHVTGIADTLLDCDGALIGALDEWDKSTQTNGARRTLCRLAHLYEFGVSPLVDARK